MSNEANKEALIRALRSVFSREPYTAIYTVVCRIQEDTPDNIWLEVVDEYGGTSAVAAIHFKELPSAGQKFEMETMGCDIRSVKLLPKGEIT
jgi:hypothetical protein